MRFPNIAYRFSTAVDTAGPTLEVFARTETTAGTAASLSLNINGPGRDRVLILTNVTVDLVPGATQAFERVTVNSFTPAGLAVGVTRLGQAAVADLRGALNWQGEMLIGGGGVTNRILSCAVVYDAGVASNSFTISVFGYVIPRGNVAPF